LGKTWTSAEGEKQQIPVTTPDSPPRVRDYQKENRNVYLKDMDYDADGNPVCLIITSKGHEPGPSNAPYMWTIVYRRNNSWSFTEVCESDHNYDMGSLYISEEVWRIVAPTEDPPQKYGVGGEIALWESRDSGATWSRDSQITSASELNHSYIRRPENFKDPFCFFWATGHPHEFSKSELYFGDFQGNVWKLPYTMGVDKAKPVQVVFD
jgi:hypothetical protein